MRFVPPTNLAADGLTRVWRGLRQGDQRGLLLGAAMVGWSWWRKSNAPQRTLVRRMTLADGESMVIRAGAGESIRIEKG